jgi:hypothetical protein
MIRAQRAYARSASEAARASLTHAQSRALATRVVFWGRATEGQTGVDLPFSSHGPLEPSGLSRR